MLLKNICWFSDRKQCITQSHLLFRKRVCWRVCSACVWSALHSVILCNVSHTRTRLSSSTQCRTRHCSHRKGFVFCHHSGSGRFYEVLPFQRNMSLSLSLSLYGFYSTPNPLLTARSAAQTSLRLKQSDPNSSLALSSHTAMICKLITTLDQTASESFIFSLREVYNEDGGRDKYRRIKTMRKLGEHAERDIQ